MEGNIFETHDYHFKNGETPSSLLTDKNNSVAYWQADYKNIRPQYDGYDVIVGDIRYKDGSPELSHFTQRYVLSLSDKVLFSCVTFCTFETQYHRYQIWFRQIISDKISV